MQLVEVKQRLAANGVSLPIVIEITGQLSYCRVARRIEGAELEKVNRERSAKGWSQYTRPVYQVTLDNPVIIDDKDPRTNDAKNFLYQKISKKMNAQNVVIPKFFADSKSNFAPSVVYGPGAGANAGLAISDRNNPLKAELANGLNVTIGMKFFKVDVGVGIGLGVDYIMVNEPEVRYWEGSQTSLQQALAKQGVVYRAPEAGEAASPAEAAQPQAQAAQSAGTWNDNAMNQPQQQMQGQALGSSAGSYAGSQGPFGATSEPSPAGKTAVNPMADGQPDLPFGSSSLTPPAGAGVRYTPQ